MSIVKIYRKKNYFNIYCLTKLTFKEEKQIKVCLKA